VLHPAIKRAASKQTGSKPEVTRIIDLKKLRNKALPYPGVKPRQRLPDPAIGACG